MWVREELVRGSVRISTWNIHTKLHFKYCHEEIFAPHRLGQPDATHVREQPHRRRDPAARRHTAQTAGAVTTRPSLCVRGCGGAGVGWVGYVWVWAYSHRDVLRLWLSLQMEMHTDNCLSKASKALLQKMKCSTLKLLCWVSDEWFNQPHKGMRSKTNVKFLREKYMNIHWGHRTTRYSIQMENSIRFNI